jgi:U4/U6.U5 tri-snRNP-associated protein 3
VIGFATRNVIYMSSRNDHRRRDRSWERSDRDRDRDRHRDRDRGGDRDRGRGDRFRDSRRRSRSRSPRRGDNDRRSGAHSFFYIYFRSKSSPGTERGRRDPRYDDRRDSDRRDRDDRRRDDRHRDDPRGRDVPPNPEVKPSPGPREESGTHGMSTPSQTLTSHKVPLVPEPRVQSEGLEDDQEEGESMDVVNPDDEAMMAMMGINGFGTTKVCVFLM